MLRRNLPAVRAVATGSTILLMVLACQKAPVSDPTASQPASKAGAPEVLPPEPHLVPGQFDVQTAHFPQQAEELTGSGTGKKEAAKDVAKEAAQEAVKEAVKEASKEAAKEALQPKPLPPNLRSVHLNPQAEGGPTAPQETAAASLVQAGLKVLPKSEGMALALVLPSLVSMGFLDKTQANSK